MEAKVWLLQIYNADEESLTTATLVSKRQELSTSCLVRANRTLFHPLKIRINILAFVPGHVCLWLTDDGAHTEKSIEMCGPFCQRQPVLYVPAREFLHPTRQRKYSHLSSSPMKDEHFFPGGQIRHKPGFRIMSVVNQRRSGDFKSAQIPEDRWLRPSGLTFDQVSSRRHSRLSPTSVMSFRWKNEFLQKWVAVCQWSLQQESLHPRAARPGCFIVWNDFSNHFVFHLLVYQPTFYNIISLKTFSNQFWRKCKNTLLLHSFLYHLYQHYNWILLVLYELFSSSLSHTDELSKEGRQIYLAVVAWFILQQTAKLL